MPFLKGHYLGLNEGLLRRLHFWTDDGRRITLSILLYSFVFIVSFIGALFSLYNTQGNISIFSETLDIMLVLTLTFHKTCGLIYFKGQYQHFIYLVRNNFFMPEQRHISFQHNTVERCEKQGRILFIVYAALCYVTAAGFLLYPLVRLSLRQETHSNSSEEIEWYLPFYFYFPLDFSATGIYIVMYTLNVAAGVMTVALIPGHDNFIVSLLLHACSQFKILNDNLENLLQYSADHLQRSKYSHLKEGQRLLQLKDLNQLDEGGFYFQWDLHMEMRRRIKRCVEHHHLIIKFVKDLEDIINLVLLDQFISSTLIFCTTAFSVIALPLSKIFNFISLMSAAMLELFLYCFAGDLLKEQSGAVGLAAYSCEWYDFPEDIKKSLLLIMMGSRKPVVLTIGKFAALTLGTFAATLRASYTYFTLLNEVNGN